MTGGSPADTVGPASSDGTPVDVSSVAGSEHSIGTSDARILKRGDLVRVLER